MIAVKRGVRIRFFLNTFSEHEGGGLFLHSDRLENFKKAGIEVHFVNPNYRLSDQLVVADGEWVLEGGLAWEGQTLEKGLGSATLIYSEGLANKKKARLELLPLWDVQAQKEERQEGRLAVPLFVLQEMRIFPAMVKVDDGDAMKIFLVLLREFYKNHQSEIPVILKEWAREIPADQTMDAGTAAFQVLKTIERLESEYEILKIENKEPDRVVVRLQLPVTLEPTVGVPFSFFDENYAKQLSARSIFSYLVILYRAQMSGQSPVWLGSESNVEADFPVTRENFRFGTDELRKQNLIEISPFSLNQGTAYRESDSREFRYLINPIASLSDRLGNWSRMRELFGDDPFKKAREMAEYFGEPEDPKVVTAYLELLKQFPLEVVRSWTQHIATLQPGSTPELLDYLQSVLRHEHKQNQMASPSQDFFRS